LQALMTGVFLKCFHTQDFLVVEATLLIAPLSNLVTNVGAAADRPVWLTSKSVISLGSLLPHSSLASSTSIKLSSSTSILSLSLVNSGMGEMIVPWFQWKEG
jgi:hypothetical protein